MRLTEAESMPRYTFTGDEPQHYPQYLDVGGDEPKALVAEPGGTYDIAQVEGLTAPAVDELGDPIVDEGSQVQAPVVLAMPPDDRWTEPKSKSKYAKGGVVTEPSEES
jgi:hypothetical protein